MSNINYPANTVAGDGEADFKTGNSVPGVELKAWFDEVANTVNGDLDEDNLAGGTQIPNSKLAEIAPSKVGDYSASASEAATVATPGDSATLSSNLATDISEELERLRYRIEANAGYRSGTVYRNNQGLNVGAAWVEPPIRGRNMLRNSGFEVFTGSSGDAPDEWTLSGTPPTTGLENPATESTGSEKRSFVITSDTAGQGITQTVGGIRASTKYLVAFKYIRTAGTISCSVAGGLSSGNYQNTSISDSSSSGVQVSSMIVQSTTSGGDLTASIVETTGLSGEFKVIQAWMFELNDDYPNPLPDIPSQSATHDTEETLPSTFTSTQWNYETVNELTLSQYIPAAGYRVIFEAQLSWTTATVNNGMEQEHLIRCQMDDGGGAATVDGPYISQSGGSGSVQLRWGNIARVMHIVERPTPGATYTFTVDVGAYNDGTTDSALLVNPDVNGVQSVSKSWLRVERI